MKRESEEMAYGAASNPKRPKGVEASDSTGERSGRLKNGVAMGMADMGSEKNFDGGRSKGVCYTHDRKSYQK